MKLKLLINSYYLDNTMSSYMASEKTNQRGLRKPAESIATHLPSSYSLLCAPTVEHKTMDWIVI